MIKLQIIVILSVREKMVKLTTVTEQRVFIVINYTQTLKFDKI